MARFGLLYLQNGNWNGLQVVPEAWVAASSVGYINRYEGYTKYKYGYQWWVESYNGFDAYTWERTF